MGKLNGKVAIVTGATAGIGTVAACLASKEASYICGTSIVVDGGMTS